VVYADCGTGGLLQARCAALGVDMVPKGHIAMRFSKGNDALCALDEIDAFYLTDFLVRQFDAFVWRPMGFDRHPELIAMMFGNYPNWSIRPRPTTRRWMHWPAPTPPAWGWTIPAA
jgi:hypothetical protein